MTRILTVTPYNSQWIEDFKRLSQWYRQSFEELIIDIHHVGSTSVVGLAAKPIIDIDIVVSQDNFEKTISALEDLSYSFEGDLGVTGRYAFKYRGNRKLPQHNLYVCPEDSIELKRHLAFRNYLREHPHERETYSKIKLQAIELGVKDIESYMDFKGKTVVSILEQAMIWADVVPHPSILDCPSCSTETSGTYKLIYKGNGDKDEVFIYECPECKHSWKQPVKYV